MPDAWITDTMPPTAGVYDVTIVYTHGRHTVRMTGSAYWPGRRSKRWTPLDLVIDQGVVVAWSARRPAFAGPCPKRPIGIVVPRELEP